MNYFWDNHWQHIIPDNKDNNNNKHIIIKHLCFGPLETIEYGITNDLKYYFEYHIIEGFEENEIIFKYIDKSEILNVINNEINLCKKYFRNEMINFFENEKEKIEKDYYLQHFK